MSAARFRDAGLFFGHGTDNAEDEALFLILEALGWTYDIAPEALAQDLDGAQLAAVEDLLLARLERRVPAAYLAHRMWFCGYEFYVDERVLVPRSPLAELINRQFQPFRAAAPCHRILDIGTGSGCIAIALAHTFPDARVTATDISAAALEVAAINCQRHGVATRLDLVECDLFPPSGGQYDLIVSNPPYVPDARINDLPAEYLAEPRNGLVAGADGMDCVNRILAGAADFLAPGGLLVVEVGEIWPTLAATYPRMPFTWVDFEHGGEGVFVLSREALTGAG